MKNILFIFFIYLSFLCISHSSLLPTKSPSLKQILNFRTHRRMPMLAARLLFQRHNTLHPIKIHPDFSSLTYMDKSPEIQKKIKFINTDILPKSLEIVSSLLKVPKRLSPVKLPYYAKKCGTNFRIPSYYKTQGTDADFILFVKYRFIRTTKSAESSEVCFIDFFNGNRPIAGIIEYNLEYIFLGDFHRKAQIMSGVHSLMKILGFSATLFPYFIDKHGKPQKKVLVKKAKIVNGKPRDFLESPLVVKEARKHFGCPNLIGVMMEDHILTGHDYDHWEKCMMQGDLFTRQHVNDGVITKISLSVFEDSGWYVPDYSKAVKIEFGKNKGCNFIHACHGHHKFPEFCYKAGEQKCMGNGEAVGTCHFTDPYLNNCMQYTHFRSELCGSSAKCMAKEVKNPETDIKIIQHHCQKATCSEGKLTYKIGSLSIECTHQGQRHQITEQQTIICPSVKSFCQKADCNGGCGHHGVCLNRKCVCDKGHKGAKCETSV